MIALDLPPSVKRAISIWREYFDATEAIDRATWHTRGRGKSVDPLVDNRSLILEAAKECAAKLNQAGISRVTSDRAKYIALEQHEDELEPCSCYLCR